MTNTPYPPEAPKDCALCPRLVEYRHAVAVKEPAWFNGAVPSFGDEAAELLVIGLAPGVTGANRTGRPFTGDWAGDLLYATIDKFGFSKGTYAADPGDGLALTGAMITNAVRCVPPENKPVGAEINACRPFLLSRIEALPKAESHALPRQDLARLHGAGPRTEAEGSSVRTRNKI
jgi:uracil-DNA glycosylase